MRKFPSHDFHLIEGKFTQDTGDTAASPPPSTVTAGCSARSGEISELYEIYRQLGKNGPYCIWSVSVEAKIAPLKSGGQQIGLI